LLDSHVFLWCISGNQNLSKKAAKEFLNEKNELFFSVVSYWEICIKTSIGNLNLEKNWQHHFDKEISVNSIRWLELNKEHCAGILKLPLIHKDPFDRLLISQAIHEDLIILTSDNNISKYNVRTIW
jgi:PIN domain nuclease of toxin-antitoxin system